MPRRPRVWGGPYGLLGAFAYPQGTDKTLWRGVPKRSQHWRVDLFTKMIVAVIVTILLLIALLSWSGSGA